MKTTITNLRALSNQNTETKKQNLPNPLESFQRNFPHNVESVTVNTLSPLFPGGAENIHNQILHNSKVVEAFYTPLKSSLLVMDPLEGRYIASNASGVHELIDDEAMRVIKLLPNLTPALIQGKPVRMQYTVPITARLQ